MNAGINHKKQAGFTLVEIGIVVAIIAVIIVIGLKVVPSVLANNRANAEMQELPLIVAQIQKSFSNRPTYNGITLNTVARLDAFPTDRVTIPAAGNATASNRWGGAITLSSGTITTTNDIARVVYDGVPERECKTVVQGVSGLARRVYVDSANGAAAGGGTLVKDDGAVLDIATLATACGATNTITYDIGK